MEDKPKNLRISAKNLGQLALPSFCPRCFWLKQKLRNNLPWAIFPGVFASIDSFSKHMVYDYWEAHDRLPPWLDPTGELGRPVPTPGHMQFYVDDPSTGIRLTGAADAIIRTLDGGYIILDFKTSKHTSTQDELLPMYNVQLNSYAHIAERRGMSPVTGIGLVYCEPVTKLNEQQMDSMTRMNGFLMPFSVKGVPLRLEPDVVIPPLLRRVRELIDCDKPPVGDEGCKDCERVDALRRLLASPDALANT